MDVVPPGWPLNSHYLSDKAWCVLLSSGHRWTRIQDTPLVWFELKGVETARNHVLVLSTARFYAVHKEHLVNIHVIYFFRSGGGWFWEQRGSDCDMGHSAVFFPGISATHSTQSTHMWEISVLLAKVWWCPKDTTADQTHPTPDGKPYYEW